MHSTVILLLIAAHGALAGDPSMCEYVEHHKNVKLFPHECRPSPIATRVMRGRNARPGEFPWMAHLYVDSLLKPNRYNMCGGSVINHKYIVTAAHCVNEVQHASQVTVRLGSFYTDRSYQERTSSTPVVDFKSEEIIFHKLYNTPAEHNNDIALVRVRGEIKFNEYIKPICLPMSCSLMTQDFTGVTLTVMGWGQLRNDTHSTSIQKAEVIEHPRARCNAAFRDAVVLPSQICAIGPRNESSCPGDSGGPLVHTIPHSRVQNVILGVVSFGSFCEFPTDIPHVYTRVSSFMSWILDHIHK